jgi:glycosyltransferase involved in cell wall biosynthesis
MLPKISVITPTRNRANTIHRVFESLNKQKFLNFEWLVCDDEFDMAEKIDLILKDDELRYNMSEVSKEISKQYSVEKISKKWDEIFRKL